MSRFLTITMVIAVSMSMLSCGSGSGGSTPTIAPPPPPPPPSGGIEGTGFAIGTIDGFGSIFVNGIEFDTATAEFLVNDQPGTESDLLVGQVVLVTGTIATNGLSGTAEQVWYDSNVEGPIDGIDATTSQLSVVGQLVRVSAQTTFGNVPGGDLDGLMANDVIRVTGFVGSDGSIFATRIDLAESPGTDVEVRGVATAVNTADMQFMINALPVDYSAAVLEGFATGMPTEGDVVEARGSVDSTGLTASLVELETDFAGDDGDEAEVEGLVTRFVSAVDFDVAGIAVTTTAATTYENGTEANLAADVLVEVEGVISAGGELVADKIEFGGDGSVRIDGVVEAVDNASDQLTVMTIPVQVTSNTRIEDKTDADLQPFGLADLNVGDYVEIRGLLGTDSMVVASRLERDDPEAGVSLRGPVTTVNEPDITILDVTVTTSAQTQFVNTTPAEFFASADGQIVEATGTWDGTRINANTIGFEN